VRRHPLADVTRRYCYGDVARLLDNAPFAARQQIINRGMGIMRNQPRPDFVARVIEALPTDGTPISSRSVFLALGEISTPGYVRIVLRQLAIAGQVIATGPNGQRVYQRLPAQQQVAADREQPVMAQNPTMMRKIDKKSPGRLLDSVTHG
jgi:hypothetical protein